MRFVGALLVAAGVSAPSPDVAPHGTRCQFAIAGSDLQLTVAVRAQPGVVLSVDWGDGSAVESVESERQRGRIALTHEYDAPGRYRVTASAVAEGKNCRSRVRITVPYEGDEDDDARQVLPPRDERIPRFRRGDG